MFRNKRRAASTASPATRTSSASVSSAASTAAAQAFLANRASNASLSSAAAAAALRSHTTSPTAVGDVQTKRTVKRQSSQSSNGSAPRRGASLTRRDSSGSMTERTFRESSPGRPPSQPQIDDTPPIPALPKSIPPTTKQGQGKKKAAAAKAEGQAQPKEQAMNDTDQDGMSSLDRASQRSPTLESGLRRISVNFSRPMSPTQSPPITPTKAAKPIKEPKTSTLSKADQEAIEFAAADAASAPVKKKKTKIAPQITEGSHLAAGSTAGGKPTGSAVNGANKLSPANQTTSEPAQEKKKKSPSASSADSQDIKEDHRAPTPEKAKNARAAGSLTKQPSVVREDREGEEREEKQHIVSAAVNGHVGPQSATINKATANANANTQLTPLDTANINREESSSPARSARFSSQPVLQPANGGLHEPPGRSISPAKSAMKRSPSPRVPSPSETHAQNWNKPGFTPSEASDVPSLASEDTRSRKKKVVHVKFDDEPVVVGEAAPPQSSTSSPMVASPQNEKQSRRSWFSFGRDKPKPAAIDEEHDMMKPRPALPSFGSVRGKRDSETKSEQKVEPIGEFHAISSDHAIGAIVAQDATQAESEPSKDPLPPEVTSVEGSGYHSDSEDSTAEVEHPAELNKQEPSQELTHENTENQDVTVAEVNDEGSEEPTPRVLPIPEIAVQPSTPGVESEEKRDSYLYVPGGFPSTDSLQRSNSLSNANGESKQNGATNTIQEATVQKEQDVSTQELGDVLSGDVTPAAAPSQGADLQQTEAEESDDSEASIYSDAASEASDLDGDGDGFGSINAIVESPLPESKTGEKPSETLIADRTPTPPPASDSSHILKEQLNLANDVVAGDAKSSPSTKAVSSNKEPSEDRPVTPAAEKPKTEPIPSVPDRKSSRTDAPPSSTKPLDKTSMRQSMRDSSPPESISPHRFRSSMRGSKGVASRSEQSESRKPKTPLKTRSDFEAIPPAATSSDTRGVLHKKARRLSAASADAATARKVVGAPPARPLSMSGVDLLPPSSAIPPVPKLKAALGGDSDSDSSFKRARHSRNSSGSKVTMRRSMRASPPTSSNTAHTKSFSARTTSPADSTRRTGGMAMRATMRSQPAADRPQSPSRKLFSIKKNSKPEPAASKPVSRLRSRLADSDDSDDGHGPRVFKSRFADSSDEEDEPAPLNLTPVRGIPRKDTDAESTDLEGEEAEGAKTPKASAPAQSKPRALSLHIPNGDASTVGEGNALASKTMRSNGAPTGATAMSVPSSPTTTKRPASERRRSFFGGLGRRKDKSSKIGKADVESAARRDTPLERTKFERSLASPDDPSTSTLDQGDNETIKPPDSEPASPSRQKLQRRTPSRTVSASAWPLPPPIPEDSGRLPPPRPLTSDGSTPAERPMLGPRGLSGTVVQIGDREVVLGKTGKKKRFTALRKAFGLKD